MPTSLEMNELYGKLRAALLTRHFAFSRYFRAHFATENNYLAASAQYANDPQGALNAAKETVGRWQILDHMRENPLGYTGHLLVCLAVEHDLGQADALPLIRLALQSLGTLFRFSGNCFEGYMLRWDPVASDNWWVEYTADGKPMPRYCRDFLIGRDGRYRYCIPFNDERYVSSLCDTGQVYWECTSQFRHMEPSMDELIWLMMGYQMVHELVPDLAVRGEVERQVTQIGEYLAEYAYLLVRPYGGFAARGASGINSTLEFILNRAFQRIVGRQFPIKRTSEQLGLLTADTTFEQVLKKVGIWPAFKATYNQYTGIAVAGTALLPLLPPDLVAGLLGLFVPLGIVMDLPDLDKPLTTNGSLRFGDGLTIDFAPVQIARALALYNGRDNFEVQDDNYKGEFTLAYALLQVADARLRFNAFMTIGAVAGSHGANFAIPSGCLGIGDPDPTAASAYLHWLPLRRITDAGKPDSSAHGPFASAVAVALGAGPIEQPYLLKTLSDYYTRFTQAEPDLEINVPLVPHQNDKGRYGGAIPELYDSYPISEGGTGALEYMSALALAWLYRKRGGPVIPGFPELPVPGTWPATTVPQTVITAQDQAGGPLLPPQFIQDDGTVPTGQDVDLFANPPVKSGILTPIFPAPATVAQPQPITEITLDVPANWAGPLEDTDTGIDLLPGYAYAIEASGTITVDGERYGPEGKAEIVWDRNHPLNGVIDPYHAHPYALLGVLRNYFFVGREYKRQPFYYWDLNDQKHDQPCRLKLRVNIDPQTAVQASGAFQCTVRVWSLAQPPLFQRIAQEMDAVEPPESWRALAQLHRWVVGDPPANISLQALLHRHLDERSAIIRFLAYNTALMEIEIDLEEFVRNSLRLDGVLGLLSLQSIDPTGVLAKLDITVQTLEDTIRRDYATLSDAEKIGFHSAVSALIGFPIVDLDQLFTAIELLLNPLGMLLQITKDVLQWTDKVLLEKLAPDPLEILAMFDLHLPRLAIPLKPSVNERGLELSDVLANEYDLAALCEVWSHQARDNVLAVWQRLPCRIDHPSEGPYAGPYGLARPFDPFTMPVFGSGLLVAGVDRAIRQAAQLTFRRQGVRRPVGFPPFDLGKLVDADRWSMKGVNLTLVNVGVGLLEIYHTHLYNGGWDEDFEKNFNIPGLPWPTASEKDVIRRDQLTELFTFYRTYHQPGNVAIIVGDFNIDANRDPTYGWLINEMAALHLVDAWQWQRRNKNGLDLGCTIGDVSLGDPFDLVCPLDSDDKRFCQDPTSTGYPAQRIDYLFVEEPSVSHTFNLDLSRLRRRPFKRENAPTGDPYLSDHLGLDVKLIVSPRDLL